MAGDGCGVAAQAGIDVDEEVVVICALTQLVAVSRDVAKHCSNGEYEVGILEQRSCLLISAVAQPAGVGRGRKRDAVAGAEIVDHRNLVGLCKLGDLACGLWGPARAAGEDEWALGGA